MDAIKQKIKVQEEKLMELQKHEDAIYDFERDKKAREEKPEEFKEVPVPKTPTLN
jgi:hypothetical protein